MDSSPVLRQQSQNKIQRDLHRMKNEQNAKPAKTKSPKPPSSPQRSHKNGENKNPLGSKLDKKTPGGAGGSRLPVLAKSLQLKAPSNFNKVHGGWEGKPLAGKAKTKKPCTRPVPFNFSQPRSSRINAEREPGGLNSAGSDARKTKAIESRGVGKPTPKTADVTSRLFGQSGPSSARKTAERTNSAHRRGPLESAASDEECVNHLNQMTLDDASKNLKGAEHDDPPKEKRDDFQFDHRALLSVLCNDGAGVPAQTSVTPQSKPAANPPPTLSIMKSHHKAGSTTGSLKSVQFSPDAAALQSILLNEGVKAGGTVGVTPRNSTCPPGRGTSIYTAQRVPVKRMNTESTEGPTAVAGRETPLNKWNPQRVRSTRHQPMSALKWQLLGQPSPYTPGGRYCKSKLQLQQEAIVQRLFDDQENEQRKEATDKDPETREEPVQESEREGETSRTASGEERKLTAGRPFIQAPQRDSVIFFSSGAKLFRAPIEKQESSPAPRDRSAPVSVDPRKPQTQDASEEATRQIDRSEHLPRESTAHKTCSLSEPVAILRRRFLPVEEARLDEEVATFTSQPVPARSRFLPPRPRCGNPLASILHFEESTRFVPITFPLSTSSSTLPRD